ncbi:MAG: amidohydrolase family protein [Breznakibacter sp.]
MTTIYFKPLFLLMILTIVSCSQKEQNTEIVLFENATIITGNGSEVLENSDILVVDGRIQKIGQNLSDTTGKTVDLKGKTIMPAIIASHSHVGILKGTECVPENYTKENIASQLKKYQDYGILHVMSMGSERPLFYSADSLREQAENGTFGARMLNAGRGFGVTNGAPPANMAMDAVFRPTSTDNIPVLMDSLKQLNPTIVKIWVDDFLGSVPKMDWEIIRTIIEEAHKRDLRVAAHVYYLSDLQQLVNDSIDIIAHSIRDKEIDDNTLAQMKSRNIVYIPTLSLDKFSYVYGFEPEWINDDFFKESLEPGVYEMITSDDFKNSVKTGKNFETNQKGFETALKNLKRVFDAGILVSLGTDSGATPLRAQGFSEHLELELMTQAGLTPLQAINVATQNAAQTLRIDQDYGTLEIGKVADFIVLNANPVDDIKNTKNISNVYKAGQEVNR